MESQVFTESEVENFKQLMEDSQAGRCDIKDDQIKDNDILFFSQYGHLEDTEYESNFQLLSATDNADNFYCISPPLTNNEDTSENQPPMDIVQNRPALLPPLSTNVNTKNNSLLNFAQTNYKEIDGKSTRIFECSLCGKNFEHQYTLMRHLLTHTNERKFRCVTCGKAFRQMSTLSQHKAIHSTERPYVCEVCNKTFNRMSTLISHRKTHVGLKPHQCHLCNKSFHQKGNLRNHIFTHTNERPYKCDVCNKGFNQMSNLTCHKMKAHQQMIETTPKYSCKLCGIDFAKRIQLRQHEQFTHGASATAGEVVCSFPDYSNGIVVDPIDTEAMRAAIASGTTPFALLRPLSGIPVLVRVVPAGDKQILMPASADDLKRNGEISVRPKGTDAPATSSESSGSSKNGLAKGCVVQIKVPVVATVIQNSASANGAMSINVMSPKSGDTAGNGQGACALDSFIYTSTLSEDVLLDPALLAAFNGIQKGTSLATDQLLDAFMLDDKLLENGEMESQQLNTGSGIDLQDNSETVENLGFGFDLSREAAGIDPYSQPVNRNEFRSGMEKDPSGDPYLADSKHGILDCSVEDPMVFDEYGQIITMH